jgi:hypothetical protein
MMEDPELAAMAKITAALDSLEESTRERVLRWARERYTLVRSASSRDGGGHPSRGDISSSDRVVGKFTDIASLYDALSPTTEGDKLLAMGYWFQVLEGQTDLDSMTLNSELKNLGHPIGNVSRAMAALASSSPRYVIQTKKSGSTKQARKRFRLTTEGIRRVEQMLGGALRDGDA